MSKLCIFFVSIIFLAGCGGGGGSGTSIDSGNDPVTNNELFKTKVIDGYISGANVYIDFNWNMTQDANEPSASEDTTNEYYYWNTSDFSSINNWSESCARSRARIAEVPVGAIDSIRGSVNEAYELHYFPKSSSYSGFVNITPLTSLFISYVNDALNGAFIDDADGCSEQANSIGSTIISKVNEVIIELNNNFNIDAETFYDDFIASGDTQLQAYGELIVDFLKTAFNVTRILEIFYEVDLRTQIDRLVVEKILSQESFETVDFALFAETRPEQLSDSYSTYILYAFYDITADNTGNLIDSNGNIYTPTVENIKNNSDFYIRNIIFSDGVIFDDNKILMESKESANGEIEKFIDYGLFTETSDLTRISIKDTLRVISNNMRTGLQIHIRNENNPYFIYDFSRIFDTRDPAELENIYNDIKDTAASMTNIIDNRYLLYDDDLQELKQGEWLYLERKQGNISQQCFNNSEVVATGEDAFVLCSENINL